MARAVLTRTPEGLIVRRPIHSSSVEQFAQEALATAMTAALVAMLSAMIAMATLFFENSETTAGRPDRIVAEASLYNFVELSAVKPDTPTLRTIIDLYALTLAHHKIDPAGRAKQPLVASIFFHDKLL